MTEKHPPHPLPASSNGRHANTREAEEHLCNGDGNPGMIPVSEEWLIPLLIMSMLEGNVCVGQIKSRVEELGYGPAPLEKMYATLRVMESLGLVVSSRDGEGASLSGLRFEPTEAGEAYIEFWAHSLADYRRDADRVLRTYESIADPGIPKEGRLGASESLAPYPAAGDASQNGHGVAGVTQGNVFFLARHGLRSLSREGEPFLGYQTADLFWRDAFELVHPDDLQPLNRRISSIMQRPGADSTIEVRFISAAGSWRWIEARVRNILEGVGDTGLLVVDLRDFGDHPVPSKPGLASREPVLADYRDAFEDGRHPETPDGARPG